MKLRSLALVVITLLMSAAAFGQTSWLDRPLNNWNRANGAIPQAPRTLAPIEGICRQQIRNPETIAERAVTRAGWSLYGATQSFSGTVVIMAMASADGMCRPNQYNAFVFVRDRFIGTLSPEPMMARSDGSLSVYYLQSATELSSEFNRYSSDDALCCPSQKSMVTYNLSPIVAPKDVDTVRECQDSGGIGTMDNVVSGTVTYRQRSALPPNATLTVRILDVSRADASAPVIAEQRVPTAGKQGPIPFDLAYDRTKIQERNRYAVRAEIRDGERLLFTTDTSLPVITQGNPRSVEINLVPVGGGGFPGGGQRDNVVRGTVTYRQRIALTPNSEVTVKLLDTATPEGTPVAETTVNTGTRQVPISFELPYEMRNINRQRTYELRAEIRSNGELRFRSETGVPVTLRGNQDQNIEIVVVPGSDAPEPITGKTFNLSAFGPGSMQIEGRNSSILIGVNVRVNTTGDATVALNRFGGSTPFSGKLIFADETTLRIAVDASGNANASGEIQITYSGRNLRSVSATNLILDGQNVTVRF
ncbi:MAG TPA: YbaY family lipoprotein [Pyrinomonadaceae bacterium]|nr:YbaY family lipoprotein [Pyrinomonadaceae bacterium]